MPVDRPRESSVCIPGHVPVPKLSSTVCQDGNTQPGCCRCLARPVCFGLVGWSRLRERAYFVGLVITPFPSFPSFASLLTRFQFLFSRTRYAPIHTKINHWYVEIGRGRLSEKKKERGQSVKSNMFGHNPITSYSHSRRRSSLSSMFFAASSVATPSKLMNGGGACLKW